MRVLFFSSVFPQPGDPDRGTFCANWARAMVGGGHAVRVVSPRPWFERRTHPRWAEVLPTLADLEPAYPVYCYPPRVLRGAYGQCMWASARGAVRRAVARFSPDCIVSYWAHPDGAAAVRFARAAGIPSSVIVGGSDVLVLPKHSARRRRQVAGVLASTDAVIVVGEHLRRRVIELGVPAARVHVVYQGVNADAFSPGDRATSRRALGIPDSTKALLFVGRLVPVKGVEVLLDACGRLRSRRDDFRLYVVGDGPLRAALQARANELGLGRHVAFAGAVDQRRLPDWYRAADLTVLSSHSEGVPNVLRESMACGTPFVATRVGGVHEVADAPGNRLVPAGDAAAMAEALAASLAEARPSGAAADALRAASGTWEASAERLIDVMCPLVAEHRRHGRLGAGRSRGEAVVGAAGA